MGVDCLLIFVGVCWVRVLLLFSFPFIGMGDSFCKLACKFRKLMSRLVVDPLVERHGVRWTLAMVGRSKRKWFFFRMAA